MIAIKSRFPPSCLDEHVGWESFFDSVDLAEFDEHNLNVHDLLSLQRKSHYSVVDEVKASLISDKRLCVDRPTTCSQRVIDSYRFTTNVNVNLQMKEPYPCLPSYMHPFTISYSKVQLEQKSKKN